LLDETAAPVDLSKATTAIFYSISNTQAGLKGVSFGDSLIKRVVETLRADFPKLKTFATLSPMPGFRGWLQKNAPRMLAHTPEKWRVQLGREVGFEPVGAEHVLSALEQAAALPERSVLRQWLAGCAAHYLGRELVEERPADPVARFHLGNGARVEQINWAADLSSKGLKQSYGLMVNYLYDLRRLDRNRQALAQGRVAVSDAVEKLYF
jgi:malonyl-CoA decarboxylase